VTHQAPTVDEAIAWICETLRNQQSYQRFATYGYEVYIPAVLELWKDEISGRDFLRRHGETACAAALIEGAHELIARGVLRQGVARVTGQGTAQGLGFSLTARGQHWLDTNEAVPRSASAMAAVFHTLAGRFGHAFDLRAQEAVACLQGGAPLAACAMAGAAAEAILLALAINRRGSADSVLNDYRKAGGRKRITDYLLGQAQKEVRQNIEPGLELLNYWRDESAHGNVTQVAGPMAAAAVDRLYRLATYADDNWATLTAPQP
jgi:hypothetical protein